MSQNNKERFKQDIQRAERNILIISWCGVVSGLALVSYFIWRLV